jgi:regulatory protein
MTSDERLAPVTYLPGAEPSSDVVASPPTSDARPHTAESLEEQARQAEKISMRGLTRRGLSRVELGNQLARHGIDICAVEIELDRLESVGLIDDRALAETLVRTLRERKGLGRQALTAELRRRGIDDEFILEALEELDDDDEQERADELAAKRARQLGSLDRETAVRRLSGFLMRKGYSGDVVRHAVDRALAAPSASGPRFR